MDFGDLDLIFKVTMVMKFEKGLSALYLLNQWPDTCIDTLMGVP